LQPGCPIGRPAGLPANDQISDRRASGRPDGRPWQGNRELCSLPIDRPVDRGRFQRASTLWRSTVRSTGPSCALLCTSVDRLLVRSTSRSTARAWQANLGI